jgi:hypothetical protein
MASEGWLRIPDGAEFAE